MLNFQDTSLIGLRCDGRLKFQRSIEDRICYQSAREFDRSLMRLTKSHTQVRGLHSADERQSLCCLSVLDGYAYKSCHSSVLIR